jgi:hypothetical protein
MSSPDSWRRSEYGARDGLGLLFFVVIVLVYGIIAIHDIPALIELHVRDRSIA